MSDYNIEIINNKLKKIIGTSHITDMGFCLHNFVTMPCLKLCDHIACSEHLYLKGDPRSSVLRAELMEGVALLKRVENESNGEDLFGVDMWYTSQFQHVAIMQKIISVFEDDNIPDRTFFRLDIVNEFDPVRIALYNKTGNCTFDGGWDNIKIEFLDHIKI